MKSQPPNVDTRRDDDKRRKGIKAIFQRTRRMSQDLVKFLSKSLSVVRAQKCKGFGPGAWAF